MARNERNDVDYFPHPVTHGKKMFYLRSKYGNDGYAVWFMLLEELGRADFHYLNLSDPIQVMYLSAEFKVSEPTLKEIINILVNFEEFDSELWAKESILYNQKFVDNIEDAYNKRKNSCISREALLTLLSSKGILKELKGILNEPISESKGAGGTQSKVKESKLKDTKLYYTEWSLIFPENLISESFKKKFNDWLAYKVKRKTLYKDVDSANLLLKKLSKYNEAFVSDLIDRSIINNWQGLIFENTDSNYEKFKNEQRGKKSGGADTGGKAFGAL